MNHYIFWAHLNKLQDKLLKSYHSNIQEKHYSEAFLSLPVLMYSMHKISASCDNLRMILKCGFHESLHYIIKIYCTLNQYWSEVVLNNHVSIQLRPCQETSSNIYWNVGALLFYVLHLSNDRMCGSNTET